MIVDTLIINYSEYLLHFKKLTTNTLKSYTKDLKLFLDFLKIDDLIDFNIFTFESLNKYFQKLKESFENSTFVRKQSSLKVFCLFLYEKGYINHDLSLKIKMDKRIAKDHVYYSQKQIFEFFDKSLSFDNHLNYRNSLIILLLYSTGLRINELLELKTNNVNLDQKVLLVHGKGNKERFVPLSNKMIYLINEYLDNHYDHFYNIRRKENLFLNYQGTQLSRQSIKKIIDDLIIKSKLDLKLTAHTFRHLCATHLLENGVSLENVKGYLGHENITTTEIYLTLSPTYIKEQYFKYDFII